MFAIDSLLVKIALIGVIGIGAQWAAWRTGKPAIALMLVAGILAGPVLGLIDPERDFGALREPIIKLAVAVILFEGGLSLKFRELRHAGIAVFMLVVVGVPVGWALGTAAAYYGAGLPFELAALFGGIMVVTGPTVIIPMLRSLNITPRVKHMLKWEAIVNDPIGALLAVGIFAYITHGGAEANTIGIATDVVAASLLAVIIGSAAGFALTFAFPRGWVPEYLKAPVLLTTVIAVFVLSDLIMHETGLITVTVMGVVMANRETYSSHMLMRFKEDLTVLLVSGVFIILSATLDWSVVQNFQFRFLLFLILLLFVVRPLTIMTALLFTRIPFKERLFVAWIAPRGIVAAAVTGLFALRLSDYGVPGAEALVPLSFAVVIATIFAHGFTAAPFARWLGLDRGKGDGVLLVGANSWTIAFAEFIKGQDRKVLVADPSQLALRRARRADLPVYHGDILDEVREDHLDLGEYQQLIAATDNDAYNALICSELAAEIGHDRVSRTVGESRAGHVRRGRVFTLAGTPIEEQLDRLQAGWTFSRTRITEVFTYADYAQRMKASGGDSLAVVKPSGDLMIFSAGHRPGVEAGDTIWTFVPPDAPKPRKAAAEAVAAG
ncbi:cation:proton antiporter [Sphingopyxis macrogoltabida]|uniref:Sodium:proton antiporter n=1 Tax=Sphingopyxis macrogoltabida TaxID=33050 RepID=A0AAC9AYT1_SPHMC|nr:sodium:proton antiporter [Sphingopyxis macrogoltabida]ALJ16030.1 sodium:proton antiporter [Sphingopyxis macrogoltabida]AMU92269.1 sodium:proton antiporter [Sphingopyxis macrogoltabida]